MFGRYRDCFPSEDGTHILVLTRCGGVNRDEFEIVFDTMHKHPNIIADYDDPTDETYCYFEFSVPVLYLLQTRPLADVDKKWNRNVGAKFKEEAKKLQKGDKDALARAEKIAKSMESQMKDKPNGGIIFMGDPDWKMKKNE